MAEKKGFDLGALLADVSEPDTGREQIEYIRLELIDEDPNNFYQLSDIEELAANIAMCGLQQPIRVRKHPDAAERYMIVSGHRRRAAVKLLAEENPERWAEVGCIVERESGSSSLQQLRLIYANSNTRTMTSAETSEQAVQVEKLLYHLKEEGYEFPGRMRDHVAAAVNASTTKLARLKVIREKLAFCWKASYKKAELAESTAYALAQMPKSWQTLIYDNYGTKPKQLQTDFVVAYRDRFVKISKTACGAKGNVVCEHKVEMMKMSCKDRYQDPCWNSYCCLKCTSLQTCRHSCAHAATKKKELKDTTKEAEIRSMEDRIRREKPTVDFIREVHNRVGIARKTGGVSVQKLFEAQKKMYSAVVDDPEQEKLESGTAKFTVNTNLPFGYSAYAPAFMSACRVADALNCSIDYLLGRSEDLRPVGGWQTGTPWENGKYVVRAQFDPDAPIVTDDMHWDGEWLMFGSPIGDFVKVLSWIPLPDESQYDDVPVLDLAEMLEESQDDE